jgi:Transglycosylase-like domain
VRKLTVAALFVAALIPAVALAADVTNTEGSIVDLPNGGSERARTMRAIQDQQREKRLERKRKARQRAARAEAGSTASPALEAIAACESGGDPHAIGGGGAYRGKYQFDQGTWASVGGSGDPAAAPEAEQDRRAAILYSRSGASSWPVCGQ